MNTSVEFEVFGDYGLFTDPATGLGGEKMSYQIPTYEAIKGVIKSCYWKPVMTWIIDEVRVMNPIQMETHGIRTLKYQNSKAKNDLCYYTYLRDVRYQVRAHFIWNKNRPELAVDRNVKKHLDIANRMIGKGGRRSPFLGTSECRAYIVPCRFGEGKGAYDNVGKMGFGMMYHGITYADEAYSKETRGMMSVRLWQASMEHGIIHFPPPQKCIHKPIREMEMQVFEPTVEEAEVHASCHGKDN